jgi:Rrf2 family protein
MKLELTRRGDYAIRAMLALAEAGSQQLSAGAIGDRMRIPASFVAQVMADLSRAGLTRAVVGRRGGYVLARHSEAITLLDVVQAAERDGRRRSCVLRGSPCAEGGACQVHEAFAGAQEALLAVLADTTLRAVAQPPTTAAVEAEA